jgi:hypothetical protein
LNIGKKRVEQEEAPKNWSRRSGKRSFRPLDESSPFIPAIIGLLLSIASCSESPIGKTAEEEAREPRPIDSLAKVPVFGKLPSEAYSFDMKVKAETPERKRNFKANMRLAPDSLIWGSVAPAFGIEAARVLLSNDTLFFMDRMNDGFYRGAPGRMRARFGIPLKRELLESIFFGTPVLSYPKGFHVFKGRDDTLHYRPVMGKESKERWGLGGLADPFDSARLDSSFPGRTTAREKGERYLPFYWMSDSSARMTRFTVLDLRKRSVLDIRYRSYRSISDSARIPAEIVARVRSPKGISTFEIGIDGVESSPSQTYPFSIPDGYAPIRP